MPYLVIMCFLVMDMLYLTNADDNSTTVSYKDDFVDKGVASSNNSTNSDSFFITTFGPIAGPIILLAIIACCIYYCARHWDCSRNGYTREQLTSEEDSPQGNNHIPRRRRRFFRNNWSNRHNQNISPHQTNVIIQPVVNPSFPSQNQPNAASQIPNPVNHPYTSAPPEMCPGNAFNANFISAIPPPIPPPPYFDKK